jgi:hypothetical protein
VCSGKGEEITLVKTGGLHCSLCWKFPKTADATGAGAICGGMWTIPCAFCEDTIYWSIGGSAF